MAGIEDLSDADLMTLAQPAAMPVSADRRQADRRGAGAVPDITSISDDDLMALAKPQEPGMMTRLNDWTKGAGKPGSNVAEKGVFGAAVDLPKHIWQGVMNGPSPFALAEEERVRDADAERRFKAGEITAQERNQIRLRVAPGDNPMDSAIAQVGMGFMPGTLGARGAKPVTAMMERPGEVPAVAPKPSPTQQLLSDFEAHGVDPTLPAIVQSPSVSRVANVIRQTPAVGIPVQRGAQKSINQTAQAVEKVAGEYGDATAPIQAGRGIQRGVQEFVEGKPEGSGLTAEETIRLPTRSSSFAEKSKVLYDEFGKALEAGAPVQQGPQRSAAFNPNAPATAPGRQLPLDNTIEALQGVTNRFESNPEFGKTLTNPKFEAWRQKLDNGTLTWPELSEFRSFVGRQLTGAPTISDIPRADWKGLYAGISRDMEAAAEASGPRALQLFKRANNYYSAGVDRIGSALDDVLKASSPEAAYADVIQAASEKGKGANVGKLYALRRSMPAEEWNDIAAVKIREMGRPSPGARDVVAGVEGNADFTPMSFVTNFEKLSPEARDVLFNATGNKELRGALDSLERVVGSQKNVERLRNFSNTGQVISTGALSAGLATHTLPTIGLMTGGAITGGAMMNPAFVRWLTGALPDQVGSKTWPQRITQLSAIAQKDPSVRQVYQSLMPPGSAAAQPPEEK